MTHQYKSTYRCKKCGKPLIELIAEAMLWDAVHVAGGSISGPPPTECPKGGEHELEKVEEARKS